MNSIINHQSLEKAATEVEFIACFKKESERIISLVDRGLIPLQEGAYEITSMMFHRFANKNLRLEDICIQAADLELPPENISGSISQKWRLLKQSVAELSDTASTLT